MLMRKNWAIRACLKCRTITPCSRRPAASGRILLRMTSEDEAGRRRQHLEAQLLQLIHQRLATVDHQLAGVSEVGLILERRRRTGNC